MSWLSVIIPTLNEGMYLPGLLDALNAARLVPGVTGSAESRRAARAGSACRPRG